jgi:hypothetical protein
MPYVPKRASSIPRYSTSGSTPCLSRPPAIVRPPIDAETARPPRSIAQLLTLKKSPRPAM